MSCFCCNLRGSVGCVWVTGGCAGTARVTYVLVQRFSLLVNGVGVVCVALRKIHRAGQRCLAGAPKNKSCLTEGICNQRVGKCQFTATNDISIRYRCLPPPPSLANKNSHVPFALCPDLYLARATWAGPWIAGYHRLRMSSSRDHPQVLGSYLSFKFSSSLLIFLAQFLSSRFTVSVVICFICVSINPFLYCSPSMC